MKYLLSFFLVISLLNSSYSQQKIIDSLKTVLDNYGEPDTTYVNIKSLYISKKITVAPTDSTLISDSNNLLKVSKQINYKKGQVLAYQKLGVLNQYILSNPYKAIEYYQKSMDIIEKDKTLKRYGIVSIGNIGTIYYEQQDYRKAIEKYKKMNAYRTHKVNALTNLGNCYGGLKLNDSAIYYFKKAEKLARSKNNAYLLANILSNLSTVESRAGFTQESIDHITESLQLINENQLEILRTPAYNSAAMVHFKNNDFELAKKYAEDALELNKSLNNLYTDSELWEMLALIYDEKKDYKKALEAYKKYTVLNDSITNTDRRLEVSRKEIQYKADKEKAMTQAEIERQKLITNSSIFGGAGLIGLSFLGFILYRKRQKEKQKTKEAEFLAKVADTELKALRSQMNPHFIFNSLNSIGDYILKNDITSASNYLTKFAKIMRLTLENSEKKEVTLSEDITLLKTYLDIEKKRFNDSFNFTFNVDESIDTVNTLVPPFILQPFIENSIKHGFSNKKDKGLITINYKKDKDTLICSVDDNGTGRQITKDNNKQSLGMKLTKNRIDIINKRKNSNSSVKVTDKDQGVYIEVKLPLELAF